MWWLALLFVPCAHEDSTGPCYWDAQRQGDGAGRSFLVITHTPIYLTPEVTPGRPI